MPHRPPSPPPTPNFGNRTPFSNLFSKLFSRATPFYCYLFRTFAITAHLRPAGRPLATATAIDKIVHGQESCRNHWLRPYLDDPRYRIRFAFVTYATDLIDDSRVFQW